MFSEAILLIIVRSNGELGRAPHNGVNVYLAHVNPSTSGKNSKSAYDHHLPGICPTDRAAVAGNEPPKYREGGKMVFKLVFLNIRRIYIYTHMGRI